STETSAPLPSMRSPAGPRARTVTSPPRAWREASAACAAQRTRNSDVRRFFMALLLCRIDGGPDARRDGEALLIAGGRVVDEVVERVPLERRLLLPVGAGEGGELLRIDAGRRDDRIAGEEDRPLADAGRPVARGAVAGADRRHADGVVAERIEAAAGRVGEA